MESIEETHEPKPMKAILILERSVGGTHWSLGDQVIEVDEDMTVILNTISVIEPIFLDYIEDIDTLLVTSNNGTIYEYSRGSFILIWSSTTIFS